MEARVEPDDAHHTETDAGRSRDQGWCRPGREHQHRHHVPLIVAFPCEGGLNCVSLNAVGRTTRAFQDIIENDEVIFIE